MNFKEFWAELGPEEKQMFANSVTRKKKYLDHVAAGRKLPGNDLAVDIQKKTGRKVTVYDLLPLHAEKIWPKDEWQLIEK
jgi:hypothetical protein